MKPILEVKNLSYTYGEGTPFCRTAVDDVSLCVSEGEFIGIIGHTGSGKSTLISHLNALLRPTGGQVLLDGEDIWERPKDIRRVRFRVGLVFQYPEYQLFEETVYRDIAFAPRNMGLSDEEIDRRVREAACFAGVSDEQLDASPFELSGGQKRRVAIAGVIAMEPQVLILDEPTAGLDPRSRDELLDKLSEYHKARGGAVIIVSHSMDEVARVASRIIVMKDAHVLLDDTPRKVFANAALLRDAGLDVPRAASIAAALRQKGIDVRADVCTTQELCGEIMRLAAEKGGAR
ncbi:MAG: energy-coupling factor transporter ATPase [Oscillospiraceae bacterium]|nr:energy-coupling factor transporter ATPase [Oscillospiraceae bacterium]